MSEVSEVSKCQLTPVSECLARAQAGAATGALAASTRAQNRQDVGQGRAGSAGPSPGGHVAVRRRVRTEHRWVAAVASRDEQYGEPL